MKRNRLFLLAAMLPAWVSMQAQTSYEAAELLNTDLSGTARYVGMGGAMSALGADVSTMSSNPAGTALYRGWDATFSFGGNWVTQRTQSNMGRGRAFDSYGATENVGLVIANRNSDEKALRFVNFGFNYRNVKRFDGKMGMASNPGGLSQRGQMAWQAFENRAQPDLGIAGIVPEDFDINDPLSFYNKNYYGNDEAWVGWLTLLGADARLIDASALNDGQYDRSSDYNSYTEVLSGGIDAFDFNLSFNLFDAVYLGATFTTYDVDRTMESVYTENFDDGDYTLQNFYRTVGSGYDFKFGAILRPFVESSFRIGVSATTPTIYTLRDYNYASIDSYFSADDGGFFLATDSKDAFGGYCYTDYTMIAPAKVNVSLGGTIGTSVALGAEYEYTDLGTTVLYDEYGGEIAPMNEHTRESFTGQHTLRLGAEKTFGAFYTRLGYNYQTGGYQSDAYKYIPVNSVQTNTAYTNIRSTQNVTCGVGYRGDVFYADAALLYNTQKADFYPFDDPELQGTSLSRNLLKGMVTLGLRF